MKYLNQILELNGIEDRFREQAEKEYLRAKERLKKFPISFDEDEELILSNHIMALIKRIYENNLIEPMPEETLLEISEEAWSYARELAVPLFETYGREADRSEIFLVGTHMEMAIASAVVVDK